jgi:hypothetical protein
MVLVSGWSDSGGWLSGGHAVRMALELCEFNTNFLFLITECLH